MKRENNSVNISFLSDYFGYSRQYFYQTQEKATEKLLITDMYSRRIMGYDLAPDLKYYHVRDALERAITNANMDLRGLIHHSDRGFQYTYKSYIEALNKLGIIPSMTQSGDPLENAIAERINGILKKEWLNKYKLSNIEDVIPVLEKAILYYNNRRPHLSLEMNTPDFVYNNPGNYKRLWTETQRYARLKECESVQEN